MSEEKRKIGGYEVTQSIHIGGRELIIGEDMQNKDGLFYMTCFSTQNALYETYSSVMASDSYTEIIQLYAERLKEQVTRAIAEEKRLGHENHIITPDMCDNIDGRDLNGEVIVIKSDILYPEYRNESHQIVLCTGGNGAMPDARGQSVFCENLYNQANYRYERIDIQGILKKEHYPEWVKDRVQTIRQFKNNPKVFEYGNKHFLGIGYLPKKRHDAEQHIRSQNDLGIANTPDAKHPYKCEDFYAASGNSPFDVFKCYETGKHYIPGENGLCEYDGEYRTQKKSKNREMER